MGSKRKRDDALQTQDAAAWHRRVVWAAAGRALRALVPPAELAPAVAGAAAGEHPPAAAAAPPAAALRRVRELLARRGLGRTRVSAERPGFWAVGAAAPGARRPCPFVRDGHGSNRGYVVADRARRAYCYRCFSARCRGRPPLVLGSIVTSPRTDQSIHPKIPTLDATRHPWNERRRTPPPPLPRR